MKPTTHLTIAFCVVGFFLFHARNILVFTV
nr:MAG TPA: hypothetical protein [Caudoviricetes sp.]